MKNLKLNKAAMKMPKELVLDKEIRWYYLGSKPVAYVTELPEEKLNMSQIEFKTVLIEDYEDKKIIACFEVEQVRRLLKKDEYISVGVRQGTPQSLSFEIFTILVINLLKNFNKVHLSYPLMDGSHQEVAIEENKIDTLDYIYQKTIGMMK